MNTEYRNKLYNRIKDVFEKEDTQERQGFMEARENFENKQTTAFELARQVVERSYPMEDVATLRHFKKKYGDPCDVVAKDKCFYFSHSEDVDEDGDKKETQSHFDFGLFGNLNGSEYGDPCDVVAKDKCFNFAHSEDVDEDGEKKETQSHFDFGLYGNLNGNEHSGTEDSQHFAHAYYREELKAESLNPDIIAQQNGKNDNPHKTKHIEANNKFLGKGSSSGHYYNDDNVGGLCKDFNAPYYLDVIGTSHCRSRAIACTKDEYNIFLAWRTAKANVVSKHQTWIDSLTKQTDQLKIGLKAYRYLHEGIELAKELGIEVDEAELVRTNSTGLTIFNPSNLASMIKGMKNKNISREDKIRQRLEYEGKMGLDVEQHLNQKESIN